MTIVEYIGGENPSCIEHTEQEFRELVKNYGGNHKLPLIKMIEFMTYETDHFKDYGIFEIRSEQLKLCNCV